MIRLPRLIRPIRLAAATVILGAALSTCGDRDANPPAEATGQERPPLPVAPDGDRDPLVLGLPADGLIVAERRGLLLLSTAGDVLRRLDGFELAGDAAAGEPVVRRGDGVYVIDAVEGILRRVPGTTTRRRADRATPVERDLPAGCVVADRHDTAWFLICEDASTFDTRIVRLEPDGAMTVLADAPTPGTWASVMVSPDGTRFLAEAGYDCGNPRVFVGATSGKHVVGLGEWIGAAREPDASAVGWTAAGEAVFFALGNCGPPLDGPGVYAFDGSRVRVVHRPEGSDVEVVDVAMWRPPRH